MVHVTAKAAQSTSKVERENMNYLSFHQKTPLQTFPAHHCYRCSSLPAADEVERFLRTVAI